MILLNIKYLSKVIQKLNQKRLSCFYVLSLKLNKYVNKEETKRHNYANVLHERAYPVACMMFHHTQQQMIGIVGGFQNPCELAMRALLLGPSQ